MTLRPATEADVPALVRLHLDVLELHARHAPGHFTASTDSTAAAAFFREIMARSTSCLVVAEKGGAIIGSFFAQEVSRSKSWMRPARRSFCLEHIAVDTAFRRRGVGGALMERFRTEACERRIEHLELVCWSFNTNAARFFQRQGFGFLHSRLEGLA